MSVRKKALLSRVDGESLSNDSGVDSHKRSLLTFAAYMYIQYQNGKRGGPHRNAVFSCLPMRWMLTRYGWNPVACLN